MKEFDFIKKRLNVKFEKMGNRIRVPISGKFGGCVSLYSPDELDERAIEYASVLIKESGDKIFYAADIGSSPYCPQALRLASIGLRVDAFDLEPVMPEVYQIARHLKGKVHYIQKNLLDLSSEDFLHSYTLVYSHRCLFFLTFYQAKDIIRDFLVHSEIRARFFLSFGNLNSSIAEGYKDRHKPVSKRFAQLDNEISRAAEINKPVCLYTAEEVKNNLLNDFPIKIIDTIEAIDSANGIKIIFEKVKHLG